ncbi:hypothetical protein ACFLR2_01340 [Chlamydiota bacterium]
MGKVKVQGEGGVVLLEMPLLALNDLKPALWHRFTTFLSKNMVRKIVFGAGAALVLLFLFGLRRKSARAYR